MKTILFLLFFTQISWAGNFEIHADGKTIFDDMDIQTASLVKIEKSKKYSLLVKLNDSAAAFFSEYTAANIGKPLEIWLQNKKVNAPMIQGQIDHGSIMVKHNLTKKAVSSFVRKINCTTKFAASVSDDGLTSIEFFGCAPQYTFRLIQGKRSLTTERNVLDSFELKLTKNEKFTYKDKIICSLEKEVLPAVVRISDIKSDGPFAPRLAYRPNAKAKKIDSVNPSMVTCVESMN